MLAWCLDVSEAFREAHAHDQLVDQKQATDNENLQGIYAKSRGYVARLAMAKDVLEQAVSIVIAASEGDHQPSWSYKIMESSVKASAAIIYCSEESCPYNNCI